MIIFESILTTFKLSVIFNGIRGRGVNWLEPKVEPPRANLACPNWSNAMYVQKIHLKLFKDNKKPYCETWCCVSM